MNSVERVKSICKERRIPISKLEKDLGFSNGYIGQLRKGVFPADRLAQIAEYLSLSTKYLMTGKEDTANGDTIIQDRDLKKKYREIYDLLKSGETAPLYFDGQPADPESINLLLKQVEISLALIEKSEE